MGGWRRDGEVLIAGFKLGEGDAVVVVVAFSSMTGLSYQSPLELVNRASQ